MALTIGVLALLVRLIWVLSVRRHGFAVNDALFYDLFAQQLAKGHGYTQLSGAPSAAWPPGYPFVLSLAFRVFGTGETVGQLFNAFIGAATVPLLYLIARRAFGRREAVFAATVLAILPAQVFLTDVLLSETFDTFLLVAVFAVLAVAPPSRWAAFVVGLLIGAATLTRGENVLLVVIPLVVWWPQLTPRLRAIRFAIVVVAAALLIVPWTVRNTNELHAFVFISTNSGQSLYAGHNPHATGGSVIPPNSVIASVQHEPDPKREVDRNRLLTTYAKNWAFHHPGRELLLIPERFLAFIGNDAAMMSTWINPGANAKKPAIGPQGTARLSLLVAIGWYGLLTTFVAALIFGAKGLWRRWRSVDPKRSRAARTSVQGALTWIALLTIVYCVGLFGQWRYHFALEPLMILVAAPAVCVVWIARTGLSERLAGKGSEC
jgi:4-amino-4-deoxy-L-arabinose transferase-like glycosyltransferase